MKYIKRTLFLIAMGLGFMAPVQAEEIHMIMCGGEIRAADQAVIADFEKSYPGVTAVSYTHLTLPTICSV